MGDSSDDEFDDKNWVFYKDRPEWKDVEPLPQDGDENVVSIAYSQKFSDIHDYLRAVLKTGEKSERALQLTKDAAALNPANYTVWQYRREILKALNKDLTEELNYIKAVIEKYPKNYQVWHHRRMLVEWLQDASQELELTERILAWDAKNYHAWQHRQWAIKTFDLFENELNYVESLLEADVRNNSAWNQRYFVINNLTGFTKEVLNREYDYVCEKILIAKENESAWNYLRGLLLHDKNGLCKNTRITEFCESLYNSGVRSPFLLALIVDMCDEQISQGGGDTKYNLDRVKELCNDLAMKYDTIRSKYWEYMSSTIEKKTEGAKNEAESCSSLD